MKNNMEGKIGYDRPIRFVVEGYICIACGEFKLSRDFKTATVKKKNGKVYVCRNKMCRKCYKKYLERKNKKYEEKNDREV
jgi:hypothetical protein